MIKKSGILIPSTHIPGTHIPHSLTNGLVGVQTVAIGRITSERSIMARIRQDEGPQLHFCILGSSKSGKTALQTYLWTHPQVFMPTRELDFHASDVAGFRPNRRQVSQQAYRELFADASEGQLLGEMSGVYLFSKDAVPNLLKNNPHIRFIVMLRNPVDMAHSSHSNLLRNRYEDESSFQKAWELQDARAAGERIPATCRDPKLLLYRKRCLFASYVEQLFERVPREHLLVHVFEEFFADPRAAYERTLAFLGLPDDGRRHFERLNEHGVPPSSFLYNLIRHLPFAPHVRSPLKRAFNTFGLRPGLAFFRWSVGKEKFPALDPSFRRQLEAEFQPEIVRLESILRRDLDVWREAS